MATKRRTTTTMTWHFYQGRWQYYSITSPSRFIFWLNSCRWWRRQWRCCYRSTFLHDPFGQFLGLPCPSAFQSRRRWCSHAGRWEDSHENLEVSLSKAIGLAADRCSWPRTDDESSHPFLEFELWLGWFLLTSRKTYLSPIKMQENLNDPQTCALWWRTDIHEFESSRVFIHDWLVTKLFQGLWRHVWRNELIYYIHTVFPFSPSKKQILTQFLSGCVVDQL